MQATNLGPPGIVLGSLLSLSLSAFINGGGREEGRMSRTRKRPFPSTQLLESGFLLLLLFFIHMKIGKGTEGENENIKG